MTFDDASQRWQLPVHVIKEDFFAFRNLINGLRKGLKNMELSPWLGPVKTAGILLENLVKLAKRMFVHYFISILTIFFLNE